MHETRIKGEHGEVLFAVRSTGLRFCEMCEEISSFMAGKRNVVVKLEDENRGDLSFL